MAAPPTGPAPSGTDGVPGPAEPLTVAPPPLVEEGQARWLLPARVAGLLATLVVIGFGGLSVMAELVTTRSTRLVADQGAEVRALAITSDSGDVTVRLGSGTRTTVRAVQRFAFGEPVVTSTVRDGTLSLVQRCRRTGWFPLPGSCTVDFEITAPPGTAVRLGSGTGDIRVEGASGDVQVRSTTGDVAVLDSRSRNVRVSATAGDVRLTFLAAPQTVAVTSGVGDVRVRVPVDENTYLVKADTGAGDVKVDERLRNGRSDRVIEVEAGAGDVTVSAR